jgi:hypothetical protein
MADIQQVQSVDEPLTAAPTPAPAPMPNGLGVAAFVVGIVGLAGCFTAYFIYLAVPVMVVGLVLGIVALRKPNRRRGFAVAGATVSGAAIIITIVLLGLFPILPAVNGIDGVPAAPVQGLGPSASANDDALGATGTRDNPAPIGTTVALDSSAGTVDWEVTLGAPTLNANDVLAAEDESAEPPATGHQYAMVPVTVVYRGTETGTPWAELSVDFVAAEGTAHASSESFAVAPSPLTDVKKLGAGESGTGNVVALVPTADVEHGTWVVTTLLGDRFYFTAR